MQGSQTRRGDAQNFEGCYESICASLGVAPISAVRTGQNPGMLDFNGDVVGSSDWAPILSALAVNKQLQHIGVRSHYLAALGCHDPYKASRRKRIPAIQSKSVTLQLCKAVQRCLCASRSLRTLHLHGLPLRARDLDLLTKGLDKSVSLESLSLAQCPISDDGLETVCQSVKYSTSIRTLDFSACNITWRGAEHMAKIIKHQAVKRHSSAWVDTLRYRKAEFEAMSGLRRITLNDNILIGDRGVASLAQELAEDLWVKALDLQRCGISNDGAKGLEKMLQSNSTLCVLDIRRNPLVDNVLIKSVITKVLMNSKGTDSQQYLWLKPPAKDPHDNSGRVMRRNQGKATYRIASRRTSSAGWRPPRAGSTGYIPWRTAARAKLQRGLPQDGLMRHSFQNASSIRVTLESESESEPERGGDAAPQGACALRSPENIGSNQFRRLQADYNRLQEELKECRLRLAEERSARLKASSRLLELELENDRLRGVNESLAGAQVSRSVLEDEQVLDSIEASFQKFHAFLDLLKDAGLGQLASMAGLEQSDFGPPGLPQLSSTQRRGHDHQRNVTDDLRRTSLVLCNSSSAAPAAYTDGHPIRSPDDVLLVSVPPALDQPRSPSPSHPGTNSGSDRSRGPKSASSVSSVHTQLSNSYQDDFSEGRLSAALSSRSSSFSQLASVRLSGSGGPGSTAGRYGL